MNTKHFKFSVGLRVILVLASVAFTATVGLVGRVDGQLNQTPDNAEVHVLHIRGPVYMIVGAGGNITASVGPDGVLMVDTGLAPNEGYWTAKFVGTQPGLYLVAHTADKVVSYAPTRSVAP